MTQISDNDAIISRIRLEQLRYYLKQNDWTSIEHSNGKVTVFKKQPAAGDPFLYAYVPKSLELLDARQRIADTINLLADWAGILPVVLARQLATFGDVFSLLLKSAPTLKAAPIVMQELCEMFGFGAAVEMTKNELGTVPVYFKRAPPVVKSWPTRALLGQTIEGSYGITVELPAIERELPTADPGPGPIERRVAARIFRGLRIVEEAGYRANDSHIVDSVEFGLNGNMCEALQELTKVVPERTIGVQIAWSPDHPVPDEFRGSINIVAKMAPTVQRAVQRMKPLPKEDRDDILIFGYVTDLHSDKAPEDRLYDEPRYVTVKWEGEKKNVRVYLLPSDYRRACDAHKAWKKVSIFGKVEQKGRGLVVTEPREFKILD